MRKRIAMLALALTVVTVAAVLATAAPAWAEVEGGAGETEYVSGGRPDPFVDPRAAVIDDRPRPDSLAGMLVGETRLAGVTLVGGEPLALLVGSDGVGRVARVGDALWDGRVVTIDFAAASVTFAERVADPAARERFREVEKRLVP